MTLKQKRLTALTLGSLAVLGATFFWAWDRKLTVSRYRVLSDKLTKEIRVLLLSDLHSCDYGEGQSRLLDAIATQEPDLILLAGDILDDEMPHQKGKLFLEALGARYPCYYVPGNHEHLSGELAELLSFVQGCGINIPLGSAMSIEIRGQILQIGGIDDPIYQGEVLILEQAEMVKESMDTTQFSILLSHRPELIDLLRPLSFDLVATGHTHGGQWRLPGGKNGLFAPHQGLFPQYSGGEHHFPETTLIISRGLSWESTRVPRLFNPPEMVLITLAPEHEDATF